MRNNLLAQKWAFITVILTVFLVLALIKPAKAQQQMYTPESATLVQIDIANANVRTTQGSRIVVETTIMYANGRTATVIADNIKPIITETNGVVRISQPKTVKVNGENVSIHHRIYIPKTLKLNA